MLSKRDLQKLHQFDESKYAHLTEIIRGDNGVPYLNKVHYRVPRFQKVLIPKSTDEAKKTDSPAKSEKTVPANVGSKPTKLDRSGKLEKSVD